MGMVNSKDFFNNNKKIDEATSNSSLSKLRYIITEKPKWKVFKKKELVQLPPNRLGCKGCLCGNDGPCKQKVTPNGVTIHYPQPKKKKFGTFGNKRYIPPKIEKGYLSSPRTAQKVKLIPQKKFPTWRVDQIVPFKTYSADIKPCPNSSMSPAVPTKIILAKSMPTKALPAKSPPAKALPVKVPPAKILPAKALPSKTLPAKILPIKMAPTKIA